uniref:Kinetochore protein NDC80 n=1 Tax=Meloidogyne enterolobii TaxID=390850 RepID=A0A6V7VRL1_MELEN|nr:unnamed protein product [Meloidogyne enterolobii]CAD2199331.1 unnamed protein product [Meloidogyne enterolobii]
MHLQRTPQTSSRPAFNHSRIDGNRLSTIGGGRISLAPDARYSIASGAPSNFRPSAFPGTGARRLINIPRASKIPDSRNLRDKEVQYDMIRKIVSFLEDCIQPSPSFKFDDRDFLRVPNRNNFKEVFEFLFRCFQPNFASIPNPKFNEEVVKLLNGLGYPYNLKNSTMQTMTTPSMWPTMLAVLEWLVNFVELEQTLHDDMRVGDQEKWQLYVSCYKKKLEMRAASAPSVKFDHDLFAAEFETYRNSKLGIDGDESFDELRSRRIAFGEELDRIRMLIAKEEEGILEFKKNIAVNVDDIKTMEKYLEELCEVIALNTNMIATCEQNCEILVEKNQKLEEKRLAKEEQIANQAISGEEAREMIAKRQMLQEGISTLNSCLSVDDKKLCELQPQLYKHNSKVCANFKSFVGRLLDLCKSFNISEELQQQMKEYSFLESVIDFKKASVENRFAQLIENLKEKAEMRKNAYQRSIEESNKKKNDLLKELDGLKSSLDRCLEGQELENERFKRELNDESRPIRTAKHNLDIAKQKHQGTSADLNKYNGILNSIGEELADKHKKYIQYKKSLDEIYDEFQTVTMNNMKKLCTRFDQQHKQKIRLNELGEILLKENKEMIEKLDSEEKDDDNMMED